MSWEVYPGTAARRRRDSLRDRHGGRLAPPPRGWLTAGGARPKAAVSLVDGRLALAKFPKPDDTRDIASGEVLALTLAAEAGIRVVEHRLVPVDRHSVAVITRFDSAGCVSIPFSPGRAWIQCLGIASDNLWRDDRSLG